MKKIAKVEPTEVTTEYSIADLVKIIRETERTVGKSAFVIGEALCRIREAGKKQWKEHFGTHVETMEDVFEEMGYAPASGYNYMKIYEVFYPYVCANNDYLAISYSKYVRLLPIMHKEDGSQISQKEAEGHLESALVLPTERELKGYVQYIQKKPSPNTCSHPTTQIFHKCTVCHTWLKEK